MSQTAELARAIEEELACISRFQALLDQEREALSASDLDLVAALAEDKLVLGQRLQQCAGHRKAIQSRSGNNGAGDPLEAAPLAKQWRELTTALDRARESNRVNGLLVSSRLAAVGNALNTLHNAVGAAPLYHSDGSTRPVQQHSGGARWSA